MDDAIREGTAIRGMYPDYVGGGSVYELLAEAYVSKGDKAAATRELEAYRDIGGRSVAALLKLADLEQETGHAPQAEKTLKKLNYIYPEEEQAHRKLGRLLLASGDVTGAIREDEAVLALRPQDMAESHYELAKALNAAHRLNEARDQVVIALEAAPDYKPAQQLLLQLSQ
jgi:tetratricopeptide (TPR) repeat protein